MNNRIYCKTFDTDRYTRAEIVEFFDKNFVFQVVHDGDRTIYCFYKG